MIAPPPSEALDLPDADIVLMRAIASDQQLLPRLIADIDWRQETVCCYGRSHPQPRLIAWHGDPGASYRYSGLHLQPAPWTVLLTQLRDRVQAAAAMQFNSVLLNYYRDGADSMGLHSDDEAELGPEPVIASLSLGAERRLLLRHKTDRTMPSLRVPLPHGSLLIMRGCTQRCWRHGIEKQRRPCEPRVNLTFRHILAPRPSARAAAQGCGGTIPAGG